ncbi:HEXXH motif-containing protein [Nocardia sp. GAS34]|uniref:HEXXH motif domain-containing protein n=1 Tax=unclassified Nocardia TaxID=2637762 RepID=UPI003D261350
MADNTDVLADMSTGHGSPAAIQALTESLLVTRTILLRKLIDEITAELPEQAAASGLPDAFAALNDLMREAPDTAVWVLTHPHLGNWISLMLLRIGAGATDSAAPLWADSGYLGWLLAAAAINDRFADTVHVVIRNGEVVLPSVGLLRPAAPDYCGSGRVHYRPDGVVRLDWDGGSIDIASTATESDMWLPMRNAGGSESIPAVAIDDVDPFRDSTVSGASNPPRLTPDQAARWRRDFAAAWRLLDAELPAYSSVMRECLTVIVPLSDRPRVPSASHTTSTGPGCVYTTTPVDSCQLALTLVHEIQHSKFNLLLDHTVLFDAVPVCRFYAPWRDDPRPIYGLMHGIYAFFGVTDFWRVHRHSACHGSLPSHVEFELWRGHVQGAIEQALASDLLTPDGIDLLNALADRMRPWGDVEVPLQVRHAVGEKASAHRTYWQVRNFDLDPADVEGLAARWRAGEGVPAQLPSSRSVEQDDIPEQHRTLPLAAQLCTLDPVAAQELSDSDQPDGDRAYLAGDLDEAFARYQRELHEDPIRPQAWAGLALVLPKLFSEGDFGILRTRAEVAARLWQAVRVDSDIVELVRWLSPTSDQTPLP